MSGRPFQMAVFGPSDEKAVFRCAPAVGGGDGDGSGDGGDEGSGGGAMVVVREHGDEGLRQLISEGHGCFLDLERVAGSSMYGGVVGVSASRLGSARFRALSAFSSLPWWLRQSWHVLETCGFRAAAIVRVELAEVWKNGNHGVWVEELAKDCRTLSRRGGGGFGSVSGVHVWERALHAASRGHLEEAAALLTALAGPEGVAAAAADHTSSSLPTSSSSSITSTPPPPLGPENGSLGAAALAAYCARWCLAAHPIVQWRRRVESGGDEEGKGLVEAEEGWRKEVAEGWSGGKSGAEVRGEMAEEWRRVWEWRKVEKQWEEWEDAVGVLESAVEQWADDSATALRSRGDSRGAGCDACVALMGLLSGTRPPTTICEALWFGGKRDEDCKMALEHVGRVASERRREEEVVGKVMEAAWEGDGAGGLAIVSAEVDEEDAKQMWALTHLCNLLFRAGHISDHSCRPPYGVPLRSTLLLQLSRTAHRLGLWKVAAETALCTDGAVGREIAGIALRVKGGDTRTVSEAEARRVTAFCKQVREREALSDICIARARHWMSKATAFTQLPTHASPPSLAHQRIGANAFRLALEWCEECIEVDPTTPPPPLLLLLEQAAKLLQSWVRHGLVTAAATLTETGWNMQLSSISPPLSFAEHLAKFALCLHDITTPSPDTPTPLPHLRRQASSFLSTLIQIAPLDWVPIVLLWALDAGLLSDNPALLSRSTAVTCLEKLADASPEPTTHSRAIQAALLQVAVASK